jgi:hypothetical protein
MRMNQFNRLVTYPLFLLPALLAQSPFDGTWRTNDDQTKLSPKPFLFSLNKGMYDCSSCTPKLHVKADGQDQPANGGSFDVISVRAVDARTVAIAAKNNGKPVYEQTRTVSDDGNTLTVKNTMHRVDNSDQVWSLERTYKRVGAAAAGAHATSGWWRMDTVNASEDVRTTTYTSSGDELSMSDPAGEKYTAKLDGKDYPVKGSYYSDSVSLKRVGERTIEETDKLQGKVVQVVKMTVSPDGKKMTEVFTDQVNGRIFTYFAEKQ